MGPTLGDVLVVVAVDTTQLQAGLSQAEARLRAFAGTASSVSGATASSFAARWGAALTSVGTKMSALGRSMGTVGRSMTRYISLPLAGIGIVAGKMAMDYETAMTKVAALSGKVGLSAKALNERLQQMSEQTGVSVLEYADALYFVASAGLKVNQVLPVLEQVGHGVEAQMGSAAEIGQLLTSVLYDYADSGMTATRAMDVLTSAIKEGKAEPADFAASIGQVLPVASQMGIAFEDVVTVIGAMCNAGDSAARAATGLRFAIANLQAPSNEAKDILRDYNIGLGTLQKMLREPGGIIEVFQLLAERFDMTTVKGREAFATVVGSARGMRVAAVVTGESADKIEESLGRVYDSAGMAAEAVSKFEETTRHKLLVAWAKLQNALIDLGREVLPIITEDVLPAVEGLVGWFRALPDPVKRFGVQLGIAAIAAGPLIRLFGMLLRGGGAILRVLGWTAAAGGASALLPAGGAGAAGAAGAAGVGAIGAAGAIGVAGLAAEALFIENTLFAIRDYNNALDAVTEKAAELVAKNKLAASSATEWIETMMVKWYESLGWFDKVGLGLSELGWHNRTLATDIERSWGQMAPKLTSAFDAITNTCWDLGSAMSVLQDMSPRLGKRFADLTWEIRNEHVELDLADRAAVGAALSSGKYNTALRILANALADAKAKARAEAEAVEDTGTKADVASGKVDKYRNKLMNLPDRKVTELRVESDKALSDINAVHNAVDNLPTSHRIDIIIAKKGGGGPRHSGGLVMHSGGLAPDEVPAVLQRGEYVINRRSAGRLGLPLLEALNRYHAGGGPTFFNTTGVPYVSISGIVDVRIIPESIRELADAIGARGGGAVAGVPGTEYPSAGYPEEGTPLAAEHAQTAMEEWISKHKALIFGGRWYRSLAQMKNALLRAGSKSEFWDVLGATERGQRLLQGGIEKDEVGAALRLLVRAGAVSYPDTWGKAHKLRSLRALRDYARGPAVVIHHYGDNYGIEDFSRMVETATLKLSRMRGTL